MLPQVPLAVNQGMAHGKVLAHADHGHVDRLRRRGDGTFPGLADDAGRLFVGLVVVKAHVVHGEQDAPLHRLETVLDAGQCPVGDGLDGVFKVGLLQIGAQGNGLESNCVSVSILYDTSSSSPLPFSAWSSSRQRSSSQERRWRAELPMSVPMIAGWRGARLRPSPGAGSR
jgi:hypothetical protein